MDSPYYYPILTYLERVAFQVRKQEELSSSIISRINHPKRFHLFSLFSSLSHLLQNLDFAKPIQDELFMMRFGTEIGATLVDGVMIETPEDGAC